jgi:iron(III) transport system permease protein
LALSADTSFSVAPATRALDWPRIAGLVAALICAAPALALLGAALQRAPSNAFLTESAPALLGTGLLILFAGGAATILGVASAGLISFCRFPGRRFFEWALVIPLAAPAYVLAYAYGGLTGPGGPIPLAWVSGAAGAGLIYALAFYPYIYLAARAAFASGSMCAWEAARMSGAGPLRAFTAIAIPMAWPGIAAGGALAAMEIAADYGAAHYFGATTLTTDIFRAWFSRGDLALALQLASILLVAAILLLWLERAARGERRFAGGSARTRPIAMIELRGPAASAALAFCALLVFVAAIAPLGWYFSRAFLQPPSEPAKLITATGNTIVLAAAGAGITLALSALIAAAAQRRSGQFALFAAAAGYAAPGAVMALGLLGAFSMAREAGLIAGLSATTALTALIWIYAARFASGGVQPIEAGLTRVTPSMSGAARVLGAQPGRRFFAIALPIAAPSILAAALILFVEIVKELPATLILRPFDFDTLAVIAHAYAGDDRLVQAALPSLLLTLVGLAPVLLLSHRIEAARHGAFMANAP